MKKASLFAGTLALAAIGVSPAIAQDGPFKDVPNDHWAYQALDRLAKDKIVVGDPDGSFKGKRTLTRYEMALIIDRLIRLLDERYVKAPLPEMKPVQGGISKEDLDSALSGVVRTGDLAGKADRSELSAYAKQADIDLLRKLAGEFQTELTTLGADVDGIKKKLDGHEKRIAAIEDAWKKRVQVSGAFNTYVRGTYRDNTNNFRDRDSFLINNPGRGVLADTRAIHDFDLNIKANPTTNTSVDLSLNFGNYLDYLGSTTNFTGSRSGAGAVGQDQTQTITRAVLSTSTGVPIIGNTALQIGRIPTQLTNLTFKGFDVDSYFSNSKTEGGNIPVDGLRASFKIGRFGITALGARIDPIRYVSNTVGAFTGDGAYGLFVGASRGAYTGGLTRNNTLGTSIGKNGAGMLDQFAGARINLLDGKLKLNATGMWSSVKGGTGFNQVDVTGADASFRLLGFGVNAEYAKSEAKLNGTAVAAVNNNNEALDASATRNLGKIGLKGGYRKVDAFFGAPGSWARLGSWVNPTDIQGAYGHLQYPVSGKIDLSVNTQSYQGTGKAIAQQGLSKNDKVNNFGGTLKYAVSSASTLELGGEVTEFTTAGNANKPRETFTNIAYGYNFSPAATLRLLYQIVDYKTKGNGAFVNADGATQKGGVFAGQFSVKF